MKPSLTGVIAAGVLLASGIAAGGASASTAKETPVKGGNLTIGFDLNVQNCIDPNQDFGLENRDLDRNVVDSLTDQNPTTGAIVPWLATSWSVNSNSSVFTFHLRKGVTFSDGEAFNAAAVKTSFDAQYKLGALSLLGITYWDGYKGTKVINPYEVQVSFKQPNAQFLQASATTVTGILSPKSYANTPADRCLGKFWGSGPFTVTSYTPGVGATLTKRTGYKWASSVETNKADAYLDTITAKWDTEDSVLVGSLDDGQLNAFWPRVALSAANQTLIKNAGGTVFSRPYPGISDLWLPNVSKGRILADPKVRQALQESINRQQIATTAFYKGYPVVTSPLESSTPYYADESSLLGYNPAAAEKLLTADGWKPGPGGIRVKDGKKLELLEPITAQSPIVDLLQQQLKKVGIDLEQKQITEAQEEDLLDKPGGDYDLIEDYYTRGDPAVLASILDTAVAKSPYVAAAQTSADAKVVSSLFAQGDSAIKPATRAAVYKKLQAYLIQQGITFPLDERVEVEGVGKGVNGLEVTDEGLIIANDIWLSNS